MSVDINIIDNKFKLILLYLETRLHKDENDMLIQLLHVGEYKVGVEFMVDYIDEESIELPDEINNEFINIKKMLNVDR
ncbi:hypothetical protein [Citrobacter koseri]